MDTPDLDQARAWGAALAPLGLGLKFGLEFFVRHGAEGVRRARPEGAPLFLDLKFHDIPNTVAGAVASACAALQPDLMTIHASGGAAMMQAARAAAAPSRARLLAVTVLTAMDSDDLRDVGQGDDVPAQVQRLANLAQGQGMDGCVCAPHEAALLRRFVSKDFLLITPGVRPEGAGQGDQKRVMTPRAALDAGATCLVIGRPITGAADPAAAARAILAGL